MRKPRVVGLTVACMLPFVLALKDLGTTTYRDPRAALTLAETQRLSWGQAGGYLTSRAGKLEFHRKDGTLSLTAPNGSLIFKDAAGKPFVLWMPGEPTLHPNAR